MKIVELTLLGMLAFTGWTLGLREAAASETQFPELDGQSLFGQDFSSRLFSAASGDDCVSQLESFHKTLTSPAELAETELTLARILCSRTGMVDPAKSLLWYDRALVRNLPPEARAKQFILRGNMHERLAHPREAVADYVRGLLICLQFNLPAKWPNFDGGGRLQPPPLNDSLGEGDHAATERLAARQQAADYRAEMEMIRREQALLMQRYYYVEAIKRVQNAAKLSDADLREIGGKLTNQEDRLDEVIRRVQEPNPRPWP